MKTQIKLPMENFIIAFVVFSDIFSRRGSISEMPILQVMPLMPRLPSERYCKLWSKLSSLDHVQNLWGKILEYPGYCPTSGD